MKKETRTWPFLSFGIKTKELLSGYDYKHKVVTQVSSSPAKHLSLIPIVTMNGGNQSSAAMRALYDDKKNIRADVRFHSISQLSGSFRLSDKYPPSAIVEATFGFPHYRSSKFNIAYLHQHAAVSMHTSLTQFPVISLAASIGTSGIDFGMEMGITSSRTFSTVFNAGIQVTKPSYQASILLTNKGDMLQVSYFRNVSKAKKISGAVEIVRCLSTKKNIFIAGGSWLINHQTNVKARVDNSGNVKTLLQHKINKNISLSISADFDIRALHGKSGIGLALSLKF